MAVCFCQSTMKVKQKKKICCVLKGAIPQKEMVRLLHELFNLP